MGEGSREGGDGLVEALAESKETEVRRERVNFLVEVETKSKRD